VAEEETMGVRNPAAAGSSAAAYPMSIGAERAASRSFTVFCTSP